MSSPEASPNFPNFSPSIIDKAPTSASSSVVADGQRVSQLLELTAKLSEELSATKGELAKLKGAGEAESIKAQLIKPYATGIFRFMCIYTAFVGIVIMLGGFGFLGFKISENVLMVLAGTTALAVIGLVKIVVSGLFNIGK